MNISKFFIIALFCLYSISLLTYGEEQPKKFCDRIETRSKDNAEVIKSCHIGQRKNVTYKELETYLSQHKKWLNGSISKRPVLCSLNIAQEEIAAKEFEQLFANRNLTKAVFINVDLTELKLQNIDFSHAILAYSNFNHAKLDNAILNHADLSYSSLSYTSFRNAKLQNTLLNSANLCSTDFTNADLTNSQLINVKSYTACSNKKPSKIDKYRTNFSLTNLTQANLSCAELFAAKFVESNLTDAILLHSDLQNAIYYPKPGTLPNIYTFATSKYDQMEFYVLEPSVNLETAYAFEELRAAYKKAGANKMRRKITYEIKMKQRHKYVKTSGYLASARFFIEYAAFGFTAGYGYYLWRPWRIMFILFFIFSIIYLVLISRELGKLEVRHFPPTGDREEWYETINKSTPFVRRIRISLYFSILSALRIGLPGDYSGWSGSEFIKLIQKEYYEIIVHEGWIKAISGIQSIISIYLFVLWFILFTSHPFE